MSILDLIFPKKCLECGKYEKYICEDCLKKVSSAGWNREGVYSVWKYEGVIRKAIIALKYKYVIEVADELVQNMQLVPSAQCLVPVPLFWYHKNIRGFNQTEILGEKIAKKMGWEFIPDLLIKRKPTKSQVELKGKERRKNLQGVFALNPVHKSSVINLKSIVLFDDVFTTGSTIKEVVKVLKGAGCKKVWGLTIAR